MTPEQITHITSAYAFTPEDRAALTSLMAESYLQAKQAAYQRAHTTAGQRVSLPLWAPTRGDEDKARTWAAPLADGIAETYEELLRSQLEQMNEGEPHEAIGDVWQGIKGIADKVAEWIKGFLPWKCEQIAQNTWNEGDNDGTEQFVDDVKKSGTDYSQMRVRVLPEESSSDFCQDYAGRDFAFDDVGSVCPNFPAHNSCQHYLSVHTINGQGEDEEVNI